MSKADTRIFNKDYDWDYDPTSYVKHNYEILIPEDHRLSYATIHALQERLSDKYGTLLKALHIGIGAVPRGSALIAPFMNSHKNGANIIMGDIGQIKLDATRKLMTNLRSGNLGIWQAHEDDMAAIDSQWKGAFQKSAYLSEVVELDMNQLPESTYDIATAEYVFESATKDHDEYRQSLRRFFRSVRPGGVIHIAYVVGSEGYTAGGIEYPAYPVTPDEILAYAQEELIDVENYFTAASGQMREEEDTHKYRGLGVLVGIRR
jgi:hypothetical protein